MKKINIGLFGFGVVGEGIYKVLEKKPGLAAAIKKIVIKQADKKRNAPSFLFSTDAESILGDETIELVVELIDDAEAALDIVLTAMRRGKSVVSANKKMIAENLPLLVKTAKANNVSFLYEAAVCGSIPVIRNLEEYFNNDLISEVTGIINGSTNYILTQMTKNKIGYQQALSKAQELGFAESDPSLDVEGWDARNKLKIIALHAFGRLLKNEDIQVKGVNSITKFDINYAKQKGYIIKLLAKCCINDKGNIVEASVLPSFVPKFHPLRLTDNEFNGLLIGGELADEQFLYGKGAGRYPTSSAVLSDISAYLFDYKYEYKKDISKAEKISPKEKLFYVSFHSKASIDFSAIGTIRERYHNQDRCYLTIEAPVDSILAITKDTDVSIICYN